MSDLSRRDFFKALIPEKKEQVASPSTIPNEIICLGSLSDFPVDANKRIKWGHDFFDVLSGDRGIKIKSAKKDEYYLLSLMRGQIFFQPSKSVPSSMVLSIMTGEMDNEERGQCG